MSRADADVLAQQGLTLLEATQFAQAEACFLRACEVFPSHDIAWKGLGNARYQLGRYLEAARAFDQAIGLRPNSATALWGGALAHAESGNREIARNYLLQTLALQPSWAVMLAQTPKLATLLTLSMVAKVAFREQFGGFATKLYECGGAHAFKIEVGGVQGAPVEGETTFFTMGMCDHPWPDPRQPRIELITTAPVGAAPDAYGIVLANATAYCMAHNYFPYWGTVIPEVANGVDVRNAPFASTFRHGYIMQARDWRLPVPLDKGPPAIMVYQLVLVSTAEAEFIERNGEKVFAALVESHQPVFANPRRAQMVQG